MHKFLGTGHLARGRRHASDDPALKPVAFALHVLVVQRLGLSAESQKSCDFAGGSKDVHLLRQGLSVSGLMEFTLMVFRHLGLDFAGRGPVERSLQVSFYLGFRRGGEGRELLSAYRRRSLGLRFVFI